MDMERVLAARQAWFDASEAEQDARNAYLQASDQFLGEVQSQMEMSTLTPRRYAALEELLSSFLDDDDQDGDDQDVAMADEQEGPDENVGYGEDESGAEMHDAMFDDASANQEASEPAPNLAESAAGRLRGAGARRNPLRG